MKEKIKKFFSMLLIELSDLEENMNMLIETTEERFKNHEITGYVWTENTALLKRERYLLQLIRRHVIEELSPGDFSSIEEAKKAVLQIVEKQDSVPKAVPEFIDRRLEKVLRYLEE